MSTDVPSGRDEVSAAVLAAAAELFAERGPSATSIRDVAARAKVNHGLVHRHFGSKEKLVGAVLDHLAAELNTLLDAGAPEADIDRALDRQARVVVRALMDGYPVGELQSSFPNIARLLDRVSPGVDDLAARVAAANLLATQIGWRLVGPYLVTALGLEELSEEQLRAAIKGPWPKVNLP